jgi:hypothetical protein
VIDEGQELEILAPLGGLAEDAAPSKQKPGTSRIFRNVLPFDPQTGKLRLTSRAGFTKLTTLPVCGADNPVQAVAPFNWPVARRTRVLLTSEAQDGVDPELVTAAWAHVQQGAAIAADALPLWDVAVLLSSGQVVIRNPAGKVVGTVLSPVPVGFTAVPHLVVDEFGGIILGASIDAQVEGGSGRLWRFTRSEDDVWTQEWQLEFEGRVVHFDARGGELVVLERPIVGENADRDELVRIAGSLGDPSIEDRRSVAWPAYTVTLDRYGAAIVASPPNALRGDPLVAFTERNESWTPRELANWKTRLHGWVDGLRPTGGIEALLNGDRVTRLADARRYPSGFGITEDTVTRELVRDPDGDFAAPVWDTEAFGGVGAPRFTSSTALVSGPNRDKADITQQAAFIPGTTDFWASFMVVQVDVDALAAATDYRVMSQTGDAAQLGLRLKVRATGAGYTLDIEDLSGSRGSDATATDSQTAILTIVHNGAAAVTSRFRLNGEHIANMTFSEISSGEGWDVGAGVMPLGPRTVFGQHRSAVDHNLLTGAAAVVIYNGSVSLAAPKLYDGVKIAGDANRTLLNETNFNRVRVNFAAADDVTVDGLVTWTTSAGAQAQTITVTGSTTAFGVPGFTRTFPVPPATVFPARHYFDFGSLETYEFWQIELDEAENAQGNWGLTELALVARSEHQLLTLLAAAGSTAIQDGGPFALGEFLVLLNPTEPGALNIGASSVDSQTATEVENVEGYLAHRFGIAHLLPVDHLYYGAGNYPVGVGDVTAGATDRGANNAPGGILAKYAPNGALITAKTGEGYGYGAAVDDAGFVWSVGPRQDSGTQTWLRRIKDEGDRWVEDGTDTVELEGDDEAEPANAPIVPRVDGAGTLHLPLVRASGECRYLRVQSDGDILSTWSSSDRTAPTAVALGPDVVDVTDGVSRGAEWAYLATIGARSEVSRLALVGSQDTGETRQRAVGLATVSCGDVFVHDVETGAQLAIGATEVFDDRARIAFTAAYGRLFMSDGRRAMVYDPRAGLLAPMEAAGYGAAPSGFGLCELWQGRFIVGRLEDDPAAVLSTARGDVEDYDLFPPVPLQGQAFVLAALDRIGRLPEPVTALAAVDDDVLFIATTTSLSALSGDPTQGAGLDTISTEVGMPLGQAWCRDPFGRLYFLDDAGRVWRWSRAGGLEELTSSTVRERLRRVDWALYAPELRWAHYADGFFLYIVPRTLVAEALEHLCWTSRTGAWSEVTFDTLDLQPMCSAQIDGDNEATRLHVIGCADGHVRYWDRTATTDDGERIDSEVLIGPIGAAEGRGMLRFQGLEVDMASEHGGAIIDMHVGDTAEQPGRAVFSWPVGPGANGPKSKRAKGRWAWLRIRGRNLGESWSFERGSVVARGAGRRRIRRHV